MAGGTTQLGSSAAHRLVERLRAGALLLVCLALTWGLLLLVEPPDAGPWTHAGVVVLPAPATLVAMPQQPAPPPAPPAPLLAPALLPELAAAPTAAAAAARPVPAPRLRPLQLSLLDPPLAARAVPAGPPAGAALPAWQRHAVPVEPAAGRPRIAIVLDDLGPGRAAALMAIALPGPLTLAFLPYAEALPALTAEARAAGHELLVHMPMEPLDLAGNNPGPYALLTDLPLDEIRRRLVWGLQRFEGFVGINNHMGSAFSSFEPGLALVMEELAARGLLFLDSRTVGGSLGEGIALAEGVPALGRDVFLDNDPDDPAAIWAQLRLTEQIAASRGQAVAIGHPHPATLAALAAWLPEVVARGYQLVPVSALAVEPVAAPGLFANVAPAATK